MPTVPTYETPQEQPRALPSPDLRSNVSPELLDAGARQAQEFGNAAVRAGTSFAEIAARMQERKNADNALASSAALKDDYLKYEQDVRQNRRGRTAENLTADTDAWWKDNLSKYSDSLDNDAQRRAFAVRMMPFRRTSLESMSVFEANQLEASHDQSWQADKNLTVSTAAATPTPQNVDAARLELQRLDRYQASRKGWDASTLAAVTLQDTTQLHKQILQGLAQSDPMGAQAYFEKFKGEIDGSLHAELGNFAKKSSANAVGEAAANDVWGAIGPKTDREAVSLDKMEEAVRTKFKDNPDAMKAGIAALRDRTTAFDKGRQERDDATEADVWKAINGGATLPQIRALPQFLQLNDKKQGAIIEHVESMAHTRTAREEEDKTRRGFAAYLQYSNPDVLDKMSENQILNLTPILGNQLGGNLMEKKRALGGKILQAGMDQQDFDHVAADVGLRPFDPHKSEDERAKLGELKYNIEQAIDSEQSRVKRPLQRDEKMQLMRRMMDDAVLRDRFWGIMPPSSAPVVLLNADQLKDAYVTVDGKKVQLGSIPADQRAAIISARRKRGLPISEQAIAETWVRAGSPKSANTGGAGGGF